MGVELAMSRRLGGNIDTADVPQGIKRELGQHDLESTPLISPTRQRAFNVFERPCNKNDA